jgi:drug/metabolite transporter (DMT)-like permease
MTQLTTAVKPRDWAVLFALSLVWGTSYILIKKCLVVFTPVEVAVLRLSISALAFLPLFLRHIRRIERRQLGLLFAVGLTGTGLPSFLFPLAQTQVNSSVAGMLNSLTPLFTLLLGVAFFGLRVGSSRFAGIGLGLAGALLLAYFQPGNGDYTNVWYAGFIILATACYATSTNLVGSYLRQMPTLTITSVSFFLVGAPMWIYVFGFSAIPERLVAVPGAWTALGYVTILALVATVLASIIFYRLIQWTNPVFSSTVSYLVPVVALLWGIVDAEVINHWQLLALVLILFGVYLSRK